jgi:hypothetical protein
VTAAFAASIVNAEIGHFLCSAWHPMLNSTFESQKRFALFHCTKTLAIDKEDVTKCG